MKRLSVLTVVFAVTIFVSGALYSDKALGADTTSPVNDFPTITSGPGNIMPDSKFFFLDKVYQEFKLAVAFSPEQRASVHMQIAGERMAELRAMQARNNKEAMVTALTEVQRESILAAKDVRDASSQGKDVVQLARTIHQALADYRVALLTVAAKYPDSVYQGQLMAAADTLSDAREVAQSALPDADQEHELEASALSDLNDAVLGVATSIQRADDRMKAYAKYASESSELRSRGTAVIAMKLREQKIAEIKRKIAELQAQLKELTASSAGTIKTTPTPKTSR